MDAVVVQPGVDTAVTPVSAVSWPAVTAGAVASCALTLVLLAFGIGSVFPEGGSLRDGTWRRSSIR